MIQENDIREKLLQLGSLDEFEDWLVRNSWNMHLDSNPSAQRLVGKIELALAEFYDGYVTEPLLRQRLRNLASIYEVRFGSGGDSESVSYTSNSTVQIPHVAMPDVTVSVS
jgi:hypothetical protein